MHNSMRMQSISQNGDQLQVQVGLGPDIVLGQDIALEQDIALGQDLDRQDLDRGVSARPMNGRVG
jgi:hypothetical protein